MNSKHKIKSYVIDYLKKVVPNFIKKAKTLTCPKCGKQTANIFPPNSNEIFCFEPDCQKIGNIFDICRMAEFDNNKDVSNDDIAKHLIDMFDIKTDGHINMLLEKYADLKWDLVPVAANDKKSNIEKNWQNKSHKNIQEWQEWLDSDLNIGVKCGKMSNILCIDLDLVPSKLKKKIYSGKGSDKDIQEAKDIKEKQLVIIKESGILDFTTLQQDTFGGVHLFYINDTDISKCCFDYKEIHIDIQGDGGQVVIEPSIVGGQPRKIIGDELKTLPEKFKALILEQRGTSNSEVIETPSDMNLETIKGLDGCCNSTFIKMGGMFRQFMNMNQTQNALKLINKNMLDTPIDNTALQGMFHQIGKYAQNDTQVLFDQVVAFLTRHQEASVRDLKECLNAESKDIKEVLAQLIQDNKVYKHRSLYRIILKADWKTEFIQESKVLPYKIPYFDNYATFRRGDMVCIGAKTGIGKTHIALNIIKKLVEQIVKPEGGIRYLSSEPGNRFAKIALDLKLKEGDFYFFNNYEPEKIELEDEAVTIIDWLLPEDFSQTANLYKSFAKQLDKHGGVCFIFSQLKENGDFYAEQMVKFFASVAAKYSYIQADGIVNNKMTMFQTEKVRESKTNQQYITIPTSFGDDKRLELRK